MPIALLAFICFSHLLATGGPWQRPWPGQSNLHTGLYKMHFHYKGSNVECPFKVICTFQYYKNYIIWLLYLLTCVRAIQNSAYGVVLDSFYTHEIGLDFSTHHFLNHWITSIFPNKSTRFIWVFIALVLDNFENALPYFRNSTKRCTRALLFWSYN